MNRNIDFTQLGGLFVYQDTLDFMQSAFGQPMDAIARAIGDKVILTGVTDQGATVTDGWISYAGEILPFTGGLKATYIVLEEIIQSEQFDDAVQRPVYKTRRLKFGNALPPAGGFPYSDITRYAFNSASIKDALSTIQSTLKSIINLEPEIILSGCTVSNVVGANMQVSGGSVMFMGNVVPSLPYSGPFPAFLKDNGTWVTAQPGAGLFVKFDPYTSQRYTDVLRRATTPPDEIKTFSTKSDRFDNNGIGRWEMKGFELLTSMQGRTPIGLWFDGNAETDVRDVNYTTAGNQGGTNSIAIQKNNLPNVRIDVLIPREKTSFDAEGQGLITTGNHGNEPNPGPTLQTDPLGDGTPLNRVQAYTIIVYAKRSA
ncbi:hypothetical protein F0L74_05865 [Chitinophaga agrisoli]|uniref:Uncharacterized protein n=1 Tax=Chitinophaga agrisoli TaxID=2607653 RepID=A0A5B2W466_9BACT|nr:hypothetical protein [Chitinophaga agrisoli]KAA2245482.1 hypothetical protein F0L74_05865 [Chitinophaga agrisoli]